MGFISQKSQSSIIDIYHFIAVSGVLSSCQTIDMNSSFVLFRFLRFSSTFCSDFTCLKSVIIHTVHHHGTGVQLRNTGIRVQSFAFKSHSYFEVSHFFLYLLFSLTVRILSSSQKSYDFRHIISSNLYQIILQKLGFAYFFLRRLECLLE